MMMSSGPQAFHIYSVAWAKEERERKKEQKQMERQRSLKRMKKSLSFYNFFRDLPMDPNYGFEHIQELADDLLLRYRFPLYTGPKKLSGSFHLAIDRLYPHTSQKLRAVQYICCELPDEVRRRKDSIGRVDAIIAL